MVAGCTEEQDSFDSASHSNTEAALHWTVHVWRELQASSYRSALSFPLQHGEAVGPADPTP